MFHKLRNRFIKLTTSILFALLLSVILSINLMNIYANVKNVNSMLQLIYEYNGELPKKKQVKKELKALAKSNNTYDFFFPGHWGMRWNRELFFRSRYCSVHLAEDSSIEKIYSKRISALSKKDIIAFTESVLSSHKTSGWKNDYKYKLYQTDSGSLLIILDASSALSNIYSILFITVISGVSLYLLILIVLMICAKYAIKPIVTAYEKQRQFITDAGHELKTPLTIILANAEILELTYGNDEWIEGIQTQSQNMKQLIHSLIQLAKMEEDTSNFSLCTTSFNDLMEQTMQQFNSICIQKDLAMSFHSDSTIKLNVNPELISQLLSILLDNSVKYSLPHSAIEMEVQVHNQFTFRITNTFAADMQPDFSKLFDRFYRQERSRTTFESHGLGLSIAQSIVQQHHGTIKAYSVSPGKITVEFTLPL